MPVTDSGIICVNNYLNLQAPQAANSVYTKTPLGLENGKWYLMLWFRGHAMSYYVIIGSEW